MKDWAGLGTGEQRVTLDRGTTPSERGPTLFQVGPLLLVKPSLRKRKGPGRCRGISERIAGAQVVASLERFHGGSGAIRARQVR